MFVDDQTAAQQQDELRPLRQFISLANGVLNDQSYAGQDYTANNAPRQFQVIGPTGSSVEGAPIRLTGDGALTISPGLVLVGIGLAVLVLVMGHPK